MCDIVTLLRDYVTLALPFRAKHSHLKELKKKFTILLHLTFLPFGAKLTHLQKKDNVDKSILRFVIAKS